MSSGCALVRAACAFSRSPEDMASSTFLKKVRIRERLALFTAMRRSFWRARFLDCGEFAILLGPFRVLSVNISITPANPNRHIQSRSIWPERAARACGTCQLYRYLNNASRKRPNERFFAISSRLKPPFAGKTLRSSGKSPFERGQNRTYPNCAIEFFQFQVRQGRFSHLSRNCAWRFSMKAAMPSFWSSVANSEWKRRRSNSKPSASGVS